MKNTILKWQFLLGIFLIWLSAACAVQTLPMRATIPQSTNAMTPSAFMTRTPTPTNTWIPSSTPTIGPPPDLELTNITVYPQYGSFEHIGQKYTLLGQTRNNTDQIMVFHDRTPAFEFTFEVWEFDAWNEKVYRHIKYSEEKKQGYDYSRIMNCILYPGEEGIFMGYTYSLSDNYIIYEKPQNHDGPLGFWITSYEAIYKEEPNLRLDYHPKTENLSFKIEKEDLVFDYDVKIPNIEAYTSRIISYIVLLDKDGKIINILKKSLGELGGVDIGITYHVHGTTATPISERDKYFRPQVELTQEMIENIAQLEILNEFEESFTCR
jgi:hypothetical protein